MVLQFTSWEEGRGGEMEITGDGNNKGWKEERG